MNEEPSTSAREAQAMQPVREDEGLRCALDRARSRIADLESRLASDARARAELVHLVSHELRTPITIISGFGRLLHNESHGPLNSEQHRFVQESLTACRRLDEFVEDLLEARIDSSTPFVVSVAPGDLHDTIVRQLDALAPLLDERGVKVEASLHARETKLAFDSRRIEQVISNLVTNAIRYAADAGVIRISTRSLEASGSLDAPGSSTGGIEVSVEDDGPGIPEADRERLFAPFVRGEKVHSDEEASSGLGIGLAISRRIVSAHGGEIRAESGELGGARFVFNLPRESAVDSEGSSDGC